MKKEICENKYEKQNAFLERNKLSEFKYDIFINEDMLAYGLLEKIKSKG